jgi:prophage antirepressor-like protein
VNKLTVLHGVRGFIDANGTAQLNLEDVARGLGFTQIATSGNEVVRWERVNKYLSDFGFVPTSGDEFIPENIFYRLAMKAKNTAAEAFQAKVADEILPTIRKTGSYSILTGDSNLLHFKKEAYMVEVTANILRLPDSGKLKLLGDFNKKHGLDVPLPAYVDEKLTESATELLKKHNVRIRTNAFNVLLINQGLLELKERPSSKGGNKEFKSLTDIGLSYGKNIISPTNVRETQPHYYPDKFEGLLKKIGLMPVGK